MKKCGQRCVAQILLLALCLSGLSGCGKEMAPSDIYDAFSARYQLPAGLVYQKSAKEGEERYLSRDTFDTLYQRIDGTDDWDEIIDMVLWQGMRSGKVCEMGIFLCVDRECAESVVRLCQNRLDMILSLESYIDTTCAKDARLFITGKTVIFLVLEDNQKAERIIKRIL